MEKLDWKKIIGNEDNITRLRTLVRDDKMPHALLFVGPEGIGKLLAARVMAAALFCHEAEKPCGKCASCRAFKAGNHPDLLVIEPDGATIKIEQIRELQKAVALAPYMADKKIVIMKEADKMTLPSANSLLKTLEEPTGEVVFILLAAQRQLLLDTILSRCVTMVFHPLPVEVLAAALVSRGAAETWEAEALARLAGGSIGKALQLKESDGLQLRDQALALLKVLCPTPMESFWNIGAQIGEMDKGRVQGLTVYIYLILRDMLILRYDADSELLYNIDIRERLAEVAYKWPKRKIFLAINEIITMQKMLKANGNARLAIERFMMCLRN